MQKRPNQPVKSIVLFEADPIRRVWVEKEEKWYFAIIDIVRVLTDTADVKSYIRDMKRRDPELDKGWGKISTPLLLDTAGGQQTLNCANIEGLFRLIQAISSPKAEPIKRWLAKVGYERLQETTDPERALNRARRHWQELGRSQKWIQQRMMGQEVRNKLTDYWQDHGIEKPDEFAALTNIIHKEWSELTVSGHKKLKNLKTENLRDHMTDAELVFTALAELSTRQIAEHDQAKYFEKNSVAAKKGGRIAGNARKQLEQHTGKKVVGGSNFLPATKNVS